MKGWNAYFRNTEKQSINRTAGKGNGQKWKWNTINILKCKKYDDFLEKNMCWVLPVPIVMPTHDLDTFQIKVLKGSSQGSYHWQVTSF